jgi:hypothetical protein
MYTRRVIIPIPKKEEMVEIGVRANHANKRHTTSKGRVAASTLEFGDSGQRGYIENTTYNNLIMQELQKKNN